MAVEDWGRAGGAGTGTDCESIMEKNYCRHKRNMQNLPEDG